MLVLLPFIHAIDSSTAVQAESPNETTHIRRVGLVACLAVVVALHLACPVVVRAQPRMLDWRVEAGAMASTAEAAPFWLSANRFGVVDRNDRAAALRLGAETGLMPLGVLSWSAGIDAVARASEHSTAFLQQYFVELHSDHLTLRAGRKERTVGLTDAELSLGSLLVSGNAAPITEVSLSARNWIGVPGTRHWVEVKGFFGHGWFGGERHVEGAYNHEKQFEIRLGGDWPVHGTGRIVHFVQWGGTSPIFGRTPQSFADYLRVVFVRPAKSDNIIVPEQENVLGNSLGAYDFRLDIDLPLIGFSAYRLFYHEDTVSLRFRNPWDGMWGAVFRFPKAPAGIRSILWEHVYTKKQGSKPDERRGSDNMYNHFLYGTGWTHYGRSIGLPLMITADGIEGVVNNIVIAHHLALSGRLPTRGNAGGGWLDLTYELRATISRNYGAHTLIDKDPYHRYETPLPLTRKNQYSFMLALENPLGRGGAWYGRMVVGVDTGQLLPDNNVGVTVSVIKKGSVSLD